MDNLNQSQITDAVEQAIRRVLSDPEVRADFWSNGYQHLSTHASNGASQWIGKRLLISLVWAAVGAGIAWLVKSGAIK